MTPGIGLIVASSAIRPNPPGQARGQCQRQTIFIAKQLNKQLYRDPGQGSSTIKLQCDIERRHAGSERNIHLDIVFTPLFSPITFVYKVSSFRVSYLRQDLAIVGYLWRVPGQAGAAFLM